MKVKLDIESDLTGAFTAFGQADTLISDAQNSAKQFGKDASTAFKNTTGEVDKFGKEIKKGTEEVKNLGKNSSAIANTGNKLKELKKEIKDLTSTAIALKQSGDMIGAEKAAKQAGHLKDELKDVQDLVKAVSGNAKENLAKGFGTGTQIAAQGFEGVLAIQGLVGTKNEEFEKQLLKLQSIQSLARIAGEFGDIGDRLKEVKLAFAPISGLYTSANAALSNFSLKGKLNLKSLAEGGKSLFTSIGTGIKGFVTSGVAGIKTLGATLAANPLGIILVVIAAVIGAMVLLKDKVKPIGALFESLGKVIDAVGDAIKHVGQAIGLVDSDFEEGLKKQIEGIDEVVKAIGDRYDFEIEKAGAAGKETEKLEKEKLMKQASAINGQIANLYALSGIAEYLDAKDLEGNKKTIKEIGHLKDEEFKKLEELTEKRGKLLEGATVLQIKMDTKAAKDKEERDKKAQEKAKEQAEKLKQLRKELNDALADLDKRAEKADLERLSGSEKILAQRDITNKEIDILKDSIEKKGKLVNKNFKFTLEQEGEFNKLRLANEYQTAQQLLQIEVEKANALAAIHKKEADDELAFIELKEKISLAKVGAAKNETKIPEAEFEKMKERVIAQIKMKAAKDSLDLKKKQIEAELAQSETQIEGEIKILRQKGDKESLERADQAEKSLGAIRERAELEIKLLNATTEEEIKNLQDQINGIDKGLKAPKGFSLGKLLGLDDETFGKLQSSIEQTIASLKELSDDYFAFQQENLDKELAANDERLSTREKNIEDLKSRLAEETALQEQGLANNVDRIKAEIEAQNAAKDAELAKDKQIKAEKKKLAKQQLIIDTALQASQLVLAIAQLFANGSSFWVGPVPVGLIVAGLAATAMTASFILGKKKAFEAVNSDQAFREGGFTGNVGVDEEAGVVHGQEFVHTADKTKKYRNLFEGIHKDNKPLIEKGLLELLEGTGVALANSKNDSLPGKLSGQRDAVYSNHYNAMIKGDNKGVESRLDNVELRLKDIINQNKLKTQTLPNGTVIEINGSKTRIIKKSE